MKIFLFCFLTFCVLETAFGGKLVDQLNEVYNNGVKKANDDIANPILDEIKKKADESDAQSCYETAQTAMKNDIASVTYELDRCRTGGLGIRNIEWAKRCSDKKIDMFKEGASKIASSAKTCIENNYS